MLMQHLFGVLAGMFGRSAYFVFGERIGGHAWRVLVAAGMAADGGAVQGFSI
jgi:hypothetical protein